VKAVEVKPDIYWVGAIDWGVRDFHGYVTPNGTTYNNYLILDEKVTLVDTVKFDFSDVMMQSIRSLVSPEKIEAIVINHIEIDHVSSLDRVMEYAPTAEIYITGKGKEGLARHFDISHWNIHVVKTGDSLCIGKRNLLFMETPMLHWPDSMVTYVKEDKLLISQDAFGQHYASSARFDDEVNESVLQDAVIEYYANILMPFGPLIKKKIAEIETLRLDIDMIAPDHGVIWRKDPGKVLNWYLRMADSKADLRVVIIYDTMWESTERLTLPMFQGIREAGVDASIIKLRATPMSVAIKEFWKARGMLVGTPTLNNIMYPTVAEFLTHLRGLRPSNRIAGAFGSFGWGGGAVKEAYGEFKRMGLEIFEPGMEVQYRPQAGDLEKAFQFGKEFAERVIRFHRKFQDA
jgi:anaerobic nitric oxide reductase flavorubredoxin